VWDLPPEDDDHILSASTRAAIRREVEGDDGRVSLADRFDQECNVEVPEREAALPASTPKVRSRAGGNTTLGLKSKAEIFRACAIHSVLSPIEARKLKNEKAARSSETKQRLDKFMRRHRTSWFQRSTLAPITPKQTGTSGKKSLRKITENSGSKKEEKKPLLVNRASPFAKSKLSGKEGGTATGDTRDGKGGGKGGGRGDGKGGGQNVRTDAVCTLCTSARVCFVCAGGNAGGKDRAGGGKKGTLADQLQLHIDTGNALMKGATRKALSRPRNSIMEVFPAHLATSPLAMAASPKSVPRSPGLGDSQPWRAQSPPLPEQGGRQRRVLPDLLVTDNVELAPPSSLHVRPWDIMVTEGLADRQRGFVDESIEVSLA
jgi:hypothetical protein